jgi:hypothetical protein
MAIPGFFKQNKPRGFNYVPRYYDPVKEELEERRRAQGKESSSSKATEDGAQTEGTDRQRSVSGTVYRSKIMRGDMKNYFHRRKERVEKHTLIRVLVIALIMILAIYFYLRF